MQLKLVPHPDFPCAAVDAIEVEVTRGAPSMLRFAYLVSGRIAELVLPASAEPARTDGLWRTTCLEAFLRPDGGEAYFELNFATSSQWAAYRFNAFRAGMAPLARTPSAVLSRHDAATMQLNAFIELPEAGGPCALGLCAVIEEISGAKSYWALAHPDGRPDFHHAAGFVGRLPPV